MNTDVQELVALGERIAENAAHIDAAMHRLLADIRRFDEERGWYHADFRSCADWLSWRVGWDLGTARDRVRVARRLGALPVIDEALQRGAVSYSKCRALVRVATPENEASMLTCAETTTAAQLEKLCRRISAVQRADDRANAEAPPHRYVNRRLLDDGMVRIEAVLRPEEAERVWASTVAAAKRVSAETLDLADGLMAIFEGDATGKGPLRKPVEVVVTVPAAVLEADATSEVGELPDGTPVSAETCRYLSCDAGIVRVSESATGEILSVGRKTRSIPAALKRALLRRDGCCRYPGCTNKAFVDGHHLEHWARGGETRLGNLILLCSSHHRLVHERGIRIELETTGQPRFYNRQGALIPDHPPRPIVPGAGLPAIRAANERDEIVISADTNRTRWDGRPVHYDWCVGVLT
jgi:hypothetical protein